MHFLAYSVLRTIAREIEAPVVASLPPKLLYTNDLVPVPTSEEEKRFREHILKNAFLLFLVCSLFHV